MKKINTFAIIYFLYFNVNNFSDDLGLSEMIVQLASAISNSGINFTNNYNENITFVFLSAFFGGCLISSTSGFKISRILIILIKYIMNY